MATLDDYFSIQTFLIVLRETLESAIIISVLLSFVHQTFCTDDGKAQNRSEGQYQAIPSNSISCSEEAEPSEAKLVDRKLGRILKFQIWFGGLLGLAVCLFIGAIILVVFYKVGSDLWAIAEHYWEGTFSILASIIISVMGIQILRVSKMQQKWKVKLGRLLQSSRHFNPSISNSSRKPEGRWLHKLELLTEKYNMVILPFVTTLREGLEAIVFIGGIGVNEDTSIWAIINAAVIAVIVGTLIGCILYRSGNTLSLQWFLITSTCFLYLVAAGLFSKGVWNFELQHFINQCGGMDVSETGHGPGSYDIKKSVWHVNCCNGELQDDGAFWMLLTAILGWTNSATYGSVISYILYWIVVTIAFTSLTYEEKHGYLPIIPIRWQLNRIKKRKSLYTPIADQEGNNNRVSIDSINSETPLQ
ncbi:Fth1 protein [Candida orthopsilosis Co 90-125]|uniref:Fth1 protein n=1 Tax=Candida orthopsilosis (strain 90-125) TaxID=1136231 RepID=H8WYK5_CANO9|nr:Fth1 protein [Candida orthopsilosis Co 90-125]CCG21320.1 Fth1 protein [Candida orthopsilosis Co 90-125]